MAARGANARRPAGAAGSDPSRVDPEAGPHEARRGGPRTRGGVVRCGAVRTLHYANPVVYGAVFRRYRRST